MSDFPAFRKIPRLYREVIVTEKIDGTNGLISIDPEPLLAAWTDGQELGNGVVVNIDGRSHLLRAGSRKRWIVPQDDNFGFAGWVFDNAEDLARVLGPGYHYGEWWGAGIQRRYGLDHKRFSLFNTSRWDRNDLILRGGPAELDVVPVLGQGVGEWVVEDALSVLRDLGSSAARGFPNPEGVVVYHTAANSYFKVTLDNDAQPKAVAA